jgi:hypothetical protein
MDKGPKYMKLFSFSLYGYDLKYVHGAIENASFVQSLGPGWKSRFFLGQEISSSIEQQLLGYGAEVVRWKPDWHNNGMFWRFTAAEDTDFDFVMFRDTDSRIGSRELSALDVWFNSGKSLHIMRDHPNHNALILGGMWGLAIDERASVINWKKIDNYSTRHGQDQLFLAHEVYPKFKRNAYINDSFFSYPQVRFKFPTPRIDMSYVGESVDSKGSVDEKLRVELANASKSRLKKLRGFLVFQLHRFLKNS